MADYNVQIINGSGSQAMKAGVYTVSVTAAGYDESTLTPVTYTAGESEGSGSFTVTATGELTFNVNETGASGGTPVNGGSLIMTDGTGTTDYGNAVTIDQSGNAVFHNVPYGDGTSPYTLYFRQISSDDNHNPYVGVITVEMSAQTQTEYVLNSPIALQSVTLTDASYTGLPVASAEMTFTAAQ